MTDLYTQALSEDRLHTVFIEQLNILYNAKASLVARLPGLIRQATFKNLKYALEEDLEDSSQQMVAVKTIFFQMKETWENDSCLAMNAVIDEVYGQVFLDEDKHFESDMSVLFYMNVIENLQFGAMRVLLLIANKLAYKPYQQLVLECLDMTKDNYRLFNYVAEEYLNHTKS